jgi:hypothetical protein
MLRASRCQAGRVCWRDCGKAWARKSQTRISAIAHFAPGCKREKKALLLSLRTAANLGAYHHRAKNILQINAPAGSDRRPRRRRDSTRRQMEKLPAGKVHDDAPGQCAWCRAFTATRGGDSRAAPRAAPSTAGFPTTARPA